MVCRILAAFALFALILGARASSAGLTPAQVFASAPPWGAQPSNILWSPDAASFLYVERSQDAAAPVPVRQYDVRTGASRVLIDPASYGSPQATPENLAWSPNGRLLAFSIAGSLYVRNMSTGLDESVARDAGSARWSPQGDALAFTRGADLYVASLAPFRVRRLTRGGIPGALLHGDLDWVYPEELRTQYGFAWSPDGREIAYTTMDERHVTDFPIVDFLPADNALSFERYPLAGEQNPRVSLHVVDVRSGKSRLVEDAASSDEYLPWFAWKPHSRALLAETIDRAQQHVRVLLWKHARGRARVLYEQSDPDWVDVVPPPLWLRDGARLWILARDNAAGLYLQAANGTLRRLNGAYRIFDVLGIDESAQRAYVSAAYPTRRDRALLAVPLDGGSPQNLTPQRGAHFVTLAPGAAAFVDTFSTLDDPPQTSLVSLSGSVRAVLAPGSSALRAQLQPVEMLSVPSQYGPLDATMLRPPGFDPHRKYPVIVYTYGGPETPVTSDVFGYMRGLYHQLLAERGFIVFSIDGPASEIDDERNARLLEHALGPASLMGQQIGVQYLRSLPYVDASRIGIWGWSFGGYEAAYALTHTTLFKAGAAVAPVTDWHLYDSIYTERYMGTPQSDPQGYAASSVSAAAGSLHGDLLIAHGTADENVHLANTISLLQAFHETGVTNVDVMLYPRQSHAFTGLADLRQLYEHMLGWWTQHL